MTRAKFLALILGAMLGVLAFVPAASVHAQSAGETYSALAPQPPKAKGGSCVRDTDFMRRNHMKLLTHQRDETMYEGVRGKPEGLTNCITCHAVKDDAGKFVSISSPKHFCRTCHDYAAVSVDCFQCHASRPEAKNAAALGTSGKTDFVMVERYLAAHGKGHNAQTEGRQ